jgi:hypothetical protein
VEADVANQRATVTMSSFGKPQTSDAASGVHSRTVAFSASKPRVCASTHSVRTQPSRSMTWSIAWNSITSVPGASGRWMSAISAVSVRRGSHTTIFMSGRAALAASMRRKRIGCAHAALLPAMKMQPAWATSS